MPHRPMSERPIRTRATVDRTDVPREQPPPLRLFNRFRRNRLLLYTREQSRELRRTEQTPGTVRRTWHNMAGYVGAQPPFSFTANGFDYDPRPVSENVSTPYRYLVTTRNILTAGNQLSQPMMRPAIPPVVTHSPPALVMAGNVGYRPTVRSRIPSFGSRVPALNSAFPGSEG